MSNNQLNSGADLKNLVVGDSLLALRGKVKKIFFYRICGTGMGAAAVLLREQGFEISGADSSFSPPMSTYLEEIKIPCFKLDVIDEKFLQQFDLIVIGNSVSGKSESARMIERCGVPFTSFPSVVGAFVLKPLNVVGIAGTHGKTTTTYLMAQVFEKLGHKPGYFIGGIMDDRPPAFKGDGSYLFIESDEYDSCYFQKFSKFQLYELKHLILTSLEFDHADIFKNVEEIEEQFKTILFNTKDPLKTIVANTHYSSTVKICESLSKKEHFITYGENSHKPKNVKQTELGSEFELEYLGKNLQFKTNLVGLQNILNITSVILFALSQNKKVEDIQAAILELKMVKRRQEVRGTYELATVIDDFAHHPRAVELTVDSIKARYPNLPLHVIFEPISATARSAIFQNEFRDSFKNVDSLIIAKSTLATSALNSKDLDCERLVQELTQKYLKPAFVTSELSILRAKVDEISKHKSIILILSNRTCIGLWDSDFVKKLKN